MKFLLQDRGSIADTGYVMIVVVALFVWFVLSVPATLVLGRILAGTQRGLAVPAPARLRLMAHSEDFSRQETFSRS